MRADEAQLRQWMIAGLGGDARAHANLLRALTPVLRRFYERRMHRDDGAIDDLVQETIIALHRRRGTNDAARPLTGWLFANARSKKSDH
ncbi:MAG: sigma factor, partial [Sphingobium sp.]